MENVFTKAYRVLRNIIVYQPPKQQKPFVLDESEPHEQAPAVDGKAPLADAAEQLTTLLDYARDLRRVMEKAHASLGRAEGEQRLVDLAQDLELLEKRRQELTPIRLAYDSSSPPLGRTVSTSLAENEKILRALYSLPENKDLILRKFEIPAHKPIKAMLAFLDGMVDKKVITLSILQPLLLLPDTAALNACDAENIIRALNEHLPNTEIKALTEFAQIAEGINDGDTVLFLDGANQALLLGSKGYASRSVSTPRIEQTVRGSQAAFTENLRTNTSLIRTIFPTSELVTEIMTVGDRAPLKCAIMYLKPVANPNVVAELKRRLERIVTDYIGDIGVLEQFIEDHPNVLFPQMLSTERPDRVAVHLAEGRIALLLNGVPFVHILPVSFFTFFHSNEDFSLKFPAGSFMRGLRLLAALLSVTLPSLYIAINYFHQEALPTELALAIAGAREAVPSPAIFEIVLMEFSFELIREAGLRIPGMLGPTIGIVGAIIIGQAAVAANIVSPIMVVIIALTGLASFAIPDYRLSFALRTIRFIYLILAATFGLVGLAIGLLITTTILCSMKSFGMPYMAPVAPKVAPNLDVVIRGSVFRQERRPDALNPQDSRRQHRISRRWTMGKPPGKGDES
ncbi:spore germination protein [Thermosinus carboxydivorans Nor1]|uniref:Spore germination protein n=1 Tax=Thermosinus carboxydivorans Nor1 TaxID=401526 RepID=A1HTL4_9FIRM|nr:spore germination protein [Thermosinus carboxydivorans]EAX46627.1 spore germination protein [Thermosinus carboxydivorans Nor1]